FGAGQPCACLQVVPRSDQPARAPSGTASTGSNPSAAARATRPGPEHRRIPLAELVITGSSRTIPYGTSELHKPVRQNLPAMGQVATSPAGASQGPRHPTCPLRGAKRQLLNRLPGAMTYRVGEFGAAAVKIAAVAVASARRNPLLQLDDLEAAFALRGP